VYHGDTAGWWRGHMSMIEVCRGLKETGTLWGHAEADMKVTWDLWCWGLKWQVNHGDGASCICVVSSIASIDRLENTEFCTSSGLWCTITFILCAEHCVGCGLNLGMWQSKLSPSPNMVGIWQFFANWKSDGFSDLFGLAFVLESPSSLMSQSAVSHTKVNKYTLSSYLRMSVQTEHRIGLKCLVRISV